MIGKLAVSRSGHDAGRIYVILAESDRDVWIADGKIRLIERPKRKNKKHIQIIKRLPKEVEQELEAVKTSYAQDFCNLKNFDYSNDSNSSNRLNNPKNEEIKRAIKLYKKHHREEV